MNKRKQKRLYFGIFLCAVAIIVGVFSSERIIKYTKTQTSYKAVTGVVSEYKYNDDEKPLKALVVRYRVNQKYYEVTSSIFSNKPEKEIGEEIEIKYSIEKPENAIINETNYKILTPLIYIGLTVGSVILFIIGITLIKSWIKKKEYSNKPSLDQIIN